LRFPQFRYRNTAQASLGKFDRLPRTPAGSTVLAFDGCGLRDQSPARPARNASYPVSVRQVAVLLHASFRHRLAVMPLRFAKPSPPSGWPGDFHPQAIEHARHATKPLSRQSSVPSSRHCPDLGHPRDFTTVVGDGSEKQGQGSALDPPKADGLWKPFIFDHRDPALTL
jgi:hypothetical protein